MFVCSCPFFYAAARIPSPSAPISCWRLVEIMLSPSSQQSDIIKISQRPCAWWRWRAAAQPSKKFSHMHEGVMLRPFFFFSLFLDTTTTTTTKARLRRPRCLDDGETTTANRRVYERHHHHHHYDLCSLLGGDDRRTDGHHSLTCAASSQFPPHFVRIIQRSFCISFPPISAMFPPRYICF